MFKIFVRALIFNQEKKVLLTKKNDHQKIWAWCWMPPWGTLEFWETPEETVIREFQEEVGIELTNLKLFSVDSLIIDDVEWIGIYYLADKKAWEVINKEPEKHEKVERVSFEEIPEMWNKEVVQRAFSAKFKL